LSGKNLAVFWGDNAEKYSPRIILRTLKLEREPKASENPPGFL